MADLGSFSPNAEKEIARKRRMAEILMQQGQMQGTQMAGNLAVPQSPIEHLMRGLQTGMGYYQQGKADSAEQDLEARRQALMADALAKMSSGDTRTAAMTLAQDPKNQAMAMQLMGDANAAEGAAAKEDRRWQQQIELMNMKNAQAEENARIKAGGDAAQPYTYGDLPNVQPQNLVSDPQMIAAAMGNMGGGQGMPSNMPPPLPINGMATPPVQPQAPQLGVPIISPDTRGLNPKDASMYNRQTRIDAQKRLANKDYVEAASKARNEATDLQRFDELQKVQPTGGWRATPVIGSIAKTLDPQMREMAAIQDRLAPTQRAPGSGASSDTDVAMFKNAIPSPDKPAATNKNIIAGRLAAAEDVKNYQSFLSDFARENGHLNGADAAWSQYINANPIFDPNNPDPNMVKLNPNRVDYKTFFNSGGKNPTPSPTQNSGGVVDYKDFF